MIEPPPLRQHRRQEGPDQCGTCERTLRSKAKSHSSSVQSSIVPACTKPAQLNSTSIGAGGLRAQRAIAARVGHVEHARGAAGLGGQALRAASALMSVAITRAPSRTKARAVARPMPWPAAVTKAVLPAKRELVVMSSCNSCAMVLWSSRLHHAASSVAATPRSRRLSSAGASASTSARLAGQVAEHRREAGESVGAGAAGRAARRPRAAAPAGPSASGSSMA